jgi:uncharacterized protein YjlB
MAQRALLIISTYHDWSDAMGQARNPRPGVEAIRLEANGSFPNNPSLPLLLYRGALREPEPMEAEQVISANGWVGSWRNGVYAFHHFHSNAHEVLACCSGSARIRFGGPAGPVLQIGAGDVAVLPAGTSHKNEGASGDFLVVGAYPEGQEQYDMMRGDPAQTSSAAANIADVPVPPADPIYGLGGPLATHWSGAEPAAPSD